MRAPAFWTAGRLAAAVGLAPLNHEQRAKKLAGLWGVPVTGSMVRAALRRHEKARVPTVEERQQEEVRRFLASDPALAPDKEPVAPAVHTKQHDHYLLISDLQAPFGHPQALDFCKRVRREYGVPLSNVLCVGDEVDQYWASAYPKDPDAQFTAGQEIDAARAELARWYAAFPDMRICNSNHGGRWAAAAKRAGIPAAMMRDYRQILDAPPGWRWGDHWIVKAKHPFRVEHGHLGPGGHSGLRGRPLMRQMSTAWGHEHANPAAIHVEAGGGRIWGLRVGSLMSQVPCEANAYEERNSFRPTLSVGVVLDEGRTPLVVPL